MDIQSKLVTIEEFEAFADAPENADRRFELFQGEIIEMTPTEEHSVVASQLHGRLFMHLMQHPVGRLKLEVRHRSMDDEHTAVVPDISFTRDENAQPIVTKGPVQHMPDLAIEVKSPDDTYAYMRRKAAYYLEHGAQQVWLVYPEKQVIEVHYQGQDSQLLMPDELLDGGDLLPGFSIRVGDLFQR